MASVSQMVLMAANPSPPLTLTYIGSATSTTSSTTINYGNFTAATDGLMIVLVRGRNNSGGTQSVTSVSIGGSLGSVHVNPATANPMGAIASRVVSAGSNNVTAVYSGAAFNSIAAVWLLTGYSSATPYSTDGNGAAVSATSVTATLDIPAGGIGVFGCYHENANAHTWTNATEIDDVALATSYRYSWASTSSPALLTAQAVSAAWTGALTHRGIVGATWV